MTVSVPHLDRNTFDYEVGYFLPEKDLLVPVLESAGIPVVCLNQRSVLDLGVVPRLARLLKERGADVLHTHMPYSGILGRMAGKLIGVNAIVHTEHSLWERHRLLTRRINQLTYSWNDAIICVSDAVRKSVRSGSAKSKGKIRTIYNGIDCGATTINGYGPASLREEYRIPQGNSIVIQVANFSPPKGHKYLLEAARDALNNRLQAGPS